MTHVDAMTLDVPRSAAAELDAPGGLGGQAVASAAGEDVPDGDGQAGANHASGMDPLDVIVMNADLRFVHCALLVGHYRSTILTGAEAQLDGLMGGAMSRSMGAGLYPSMIGAHHVFGDLTALADTASPVAQPAAVIVAGLGDEGELRQADLVYTVRLAILAFAQRLCERGIAMPAGFSMAATLAGSGGSGMSPGCSAQALIQAAHEANAKIAQLEGWPRLSRLTLLELFLERATDAWHALRMQEQADRKLLRLNGRIRSGRGALRRSLDSSYRGTSYDFISALQYAEPGGANPGITYKLDTRRARAEVHAHRAQATLLREFAAASNNPEIEENIGRTLFNLLIPVEMEPFLSGSSEMVMELDANTAGIPWELLDTHPERSASDKRPWAIRCKLVRKLQLKDFRASQRNAGTEDNVLIIGNPKCASERYRSIEGAKEEAMAVAERLLEAGSGLSRRQVTLLANQNDAQSILIALLKEPYRIVHIAGHGEFGANGGVVLSSANTFLGANEVSAMRSIPELVFVNCCHLAGRDTASVLGLNDRPQFAANLADALIRIGVRCVVAAGWAVEDRAAKDFAVAFYVALLNGARFIEAVGAARTAAWEANPQSNTWAAYQCYGDPDWRWRRVCMPSAKSPVVPPEDEFGAIASPASLLIVLETLAIELECGDAGSGWALPRLDYLEAEFSGLWGDMGAVADAFAVAYAAAGQGDRAIKWYQRSLRAPDGLAPLRAVDGLRTQLNMRAASTQGAQPGDAAWLEQLSTIERFNMGRPSHPLKEDHER
ncbi:CHAT domain-containing protein [Massilia sp. PAMC28688]|uniref:CHAT domain-containing protein n=1 Tax=Massilia sp. PAMC28688 TaxID=2861283 RepID=UPI001C62DF39|nr:CHAT domain-containing protein [Massilia sp. PAMC28688]QYF94443.1 CHAT domain-containing protein [Massilia sp. PAMC28688]